MFTNGRSVGLGLRDRMRTTVWAVLYIVVVSVVAMISPAHGEQYDLMAAHGALDWDTNGDGVADGWSFARDGTIAGDIKLVKANDGLAEQIRTNSAAGMAGELRLFYEVPVGSSGLAAVGDTIQAAALIRSSVPRGGYVAADVSCLDAQRNVVAAHYILPETGVSDSRWRPVSVGFTIPSGTAWLAVSFRLGIRNGWGNGSFYVDNVQLSKDVAQVPEPPAGAIQAFIECNPGKDPIYAAKRYGVFIAYPRTYAYTRTWNAYNGPAKVVLYQLHGATMNPDGGVPTDPMGYAWIDQFHPEWFLKGSDGQRITDSSDSAKLALDVGNPEYQRVWVRSAIKNAKDTGADGVLIGSIRTSLAWAGVRRPINYPDNESWLAAENAFVRYAAAEIRKAGLLALGGGGDSTWSDLPWSDWMGFLDGAHYEAPCDDADCHIVPYDNWKKLLDGCRLFPSKLYLYGASHPVNDDVAGFDLASFLLAAGPNSYFGYRGAGGPIPRYHTFLDISIGGPLGEPEEVGYRTYHRSFEKGEVYVNADAANDATVQVPQDLQDVYGNPVSPGPRDLGPRQGLILLRSTAVPGGGGGGPAGQIVPMDLLGGLGDFEYAGDTSWNVYGHPDYDFDAESGWVGDYRSTFEFRGVVVRRVGGSGAGDTVTIETRHSPDLVMSSKTYEFTDGSGARPGSVEVNVGTDPSPANAIAKLRDAIDTEQGSGGPGAVSVSVSGIVLYIKPALHWELRAFLDSDSSESRIVSVHRTWRFGYDPAEPDDSVAVGWRRKSGANVNPGTNHVFRIVAGEGIGGSNCQYMGFKDFHGPSGQVLLVSEFKVSDKPSDVHVGDTITLKLDHVRMSEFDVPSGGSVAYKLVMWLGDERVMKSIPASSTAASVELVAGPVQSGASWVIAGLYVDATGDLGLRRPGVYVDGAHLYVKRTGSTEYATWQVPVSRDRAVRTLVYSGDWESDRYDIYDVARECDAVIVGESNGEFAARLRYLNPSIKVYSYENPSVTDYRDSRGVDPWYADTPLKMGWVLANHTDWLYPNDAGFYVNDVGYPNSYTTRISDAGYQDVWAQRCRDIAARWRFDGVFIDGPIVLSEARSGGKLVSPSREPWELQSFLHRAVPLIKSAGLDVLENIAGYHLESARGVVFLNPSWVPVAPYNTADYTANSTGTVADGYFQEYGFFGSDRSGADGIRNWYELTYWKACLDDMDAVKRWNSAVGGSSAKRYHLLVFGSDRADDPAQGMDGWMRFGLCSYLLGQNEWTTFSSGVRPTYGQWTDLSITKRLGAPSGDHLAYNGDQYVRYRNYAATTDGGVGGVVVVNGHHDQTKTYQIGFNAVDESGTAIPAGTTITLKPHTGRILLRS